MPKKTEREDPLGFPTSILSQTSTKIEGGPFGDHFFFEKMSHNTEKKSKETFLILLARSNGSI